jgi:hypothetical protein
MSVTDVFVTDEFEAWWHSLSAGAQEDVAFVVGLLEQKGVALGFPYSSAVRSAKLRLRELRVSAEGDALRILYAFDPWRSAILLIGGTKAGRGDRFYADAVPKAEVLYEEYITLRKREENRR